MDMDGQRLPPEMGEDRGIGLPGEVLGVLKRRLAAGEAERLGAGEGQRVIEGIGAADHVKAAGEVRGRGGDADSHGVHGLSSFFSKT